MTYPIDGMAEPKQNRLQMRAYNPNNQTRFLTYKEARNKLKTPKFRKRKK